MVKDSQNWGQTLTQCLETAGSRLCPKEHWQPKDSARGLGLVQLRVTLTLGPQDSGTPSGEPPPTSLDKAQVPAPLQITQASALPQSPSFFLGASVTAAISLDQQAQDYPSRGLRAHPGTFWYNMLQVCTGS